ncbi:DMT family transporter [Vibrio sp. NTOU-M3]|uniref:DMT family transporter n=1 Tax=Vibrio sp. NTOU-M3 TaxID=3234954 RepID=UPI00349F67AC
MPMSPILFMLGSTLSLSVTGLLSKYLTHEMNIYLLSELRFLIPALLLLPLFFTQRFRFPASGVRRALLIRAGSIAICQLAFLFSLEHLSLVESVVLFSTGPLFIPLLERVFFAVPLKLSAVVSLCITFLGVVLMTGDLSSFHLRLELLIGLAAGLFNAASQLSLYRMSKSSLGATEINFWTFLLAAALLLPMTLWVWVSGSGESVDWVNEQAFLSGAALVTMSVMIINTQICRAKAYKMVASNSQLAPLIFTNLLFAAIWQVLFFDEAFSLHQIFGISLMVFALISQSVMPRWRSNRSMTIKQRAA